MGLLNYTTKIDPDKTAAEIGNAEASTREEVAYDKGFRDGHRHAGNVQWIKFAVVMFGMAYFASFLAFATVWAAATHFGTV